MEGKRVTCNRPVEIDIAKGADLFLQIRPRNRLLPGDTSS